MKAAETDLLLPGTALPTMSILQAPHAVMLERCLAQFEPESSHAHPLAKHYAKVEAETLKQQPPSELR